MTPMEMFMIEVAERYGVQLTTPPDRWEYERGTAFLVRQHPDSGYHVAIARMVVNWRIIECDDRGNPNGRYWCYPLGDLRRFAYVAEQAQNYSEEPEGWIKSHSGPATPYRHPNS